MVWGLGQVVSIQDVLSEVIEALHQRSVRDHPRVLSCTQQGGGVCYRCPLPPVLLDILRETGDDYHIFISVIAHIHPEYRSRHLCAGSHQQQPQHMEGM